MSENNKYWHAIYTKPRWEKKVYGLLQEMGFEAYCPLNKVRRQWKDRLKWIDEPLFKSYLFVKVRDEELSRVRLVAGIVNFVYWLGKPAVVRDREIDTIRKFLNDYQEIQVIPLNVEANAKVKIRQGIFMDKDAVVKKVLKNKVQVIIQSIGFSLVATVDKSNLTVQRKR